MVAAKIRSVRIPRTFPVDRGQHQHQIMGIISLPANSCTVRLSRGNNGTSYAMEVECWVFSEKKSAFSFRRQNQADEVVVRAGKCGKSDAEFESSNRSRAKDENRTAIKNRRGNSTNSTANYPTKTIPKFAFKSRCR